MNQDQNGTDPRNHFGDLESLRNWIPIARRLRQVSSTSHGPGILRLTILFDELGEPKIYTLKQVRIEPRSRIDDVLEWLSGEDGIT